MAELDITYFEEKLLDIQDSILGLSQLVDGASKVVSLDQNRVGRLSRMDALQGQAMALANADRQQQQLILITNALERIDDGCYGRCLECDHAIAIARLEIEPTAEYCIHCAEKREHSNV